MERRRPRRPNPNAAHFPIFSYVDYDFQFKAASYPIGLKSTYPEELVRRIAAAFISFQMGNTGIDYTYKRYLKDKRYEMNDGSRLDLKVTRIISRRMTLLSGLILRATQSEGKRLGEIVCEWTFFRLPFAINFILSCANRGAFFETASIGRMALEQMAWAAKIDEFDDRDAIQNESATRAIGSLRKLCPIAGRLYGWLSVHAHWAYEGHIKAWDMDEEGRLGALFATPEFKARSLALSILLAVIAEKTFIALKRPVVSEIFASKDETSIIDFDPENLFDADVTPAVKELRELLEQKLLIDLAEEIVRVLPNDDDVNELKEMTFAAAA
jgi:hypothetical protein